MGPPNAAHALPGTNVAAPGLAIAATLPSMTDRRCPALFVSAPASGQGKTTVTAALARRHRDAGRRVRVFKTGPDFIDPTILARASGSPVYQLDLWMGGEEHCRDLLYDAAGASDLILVEGVMGLFDGDPSSADLAALFDIPVVAVIDGGAMAQTFGALALGLASYRRGLPIAGVVANAVAGEFHYRLLAQSVRPPVEVLGWMPRDAAASLPERHLGLFRAEEIADVDQRIARAAASLVLERDGVPPAVTFAAPARGPVPRELAGVRIAVARDLAFSFVYQANLDLLRASGAELAHFSPLADDSLPDADALYLPGGYPELHAGRLAGNRAMKASIRRHHHDGKPIVAECGGMMYLCEELVDAGGASHPMTALLPGRTVMQERVAALAMQSAELPEGRLRGQTFHHSRYEGGPTPASRASCPNGSGIAEGVYRAGRLAASYIHFYFPSNPHAAAALFKP